jgi:hypothetical protein
MTGEALFAHIEKLQGDEPWGSVLDAGTGRHSLEWALGLPGSRVTAVTFEPCRAQALERDLAPRLRPVDRIICGAWTDPAFLHGEVFDVVIADYLLGAVDGHTPYFQYQLFERLRPHARGRLYVVGLEPYDESVRSDEAGLVLEISRLRDACILLAGHRAYREYPLEWVLRRLEAAGFAVEDASVFPIIYGPKFVHGQLDVCEQKLPYLGDRALARALARRVEDLRERALGFIRSHGGIRFGEDYVVAARRAGQAPASSPGSKTS